MYAKRVDDIKAISETADLTKRKPKIASLLEQIFDSEGAFDIAWWLRERQDPFSENLLEKNDKSISNYGSRLKQSISSHGSRLKLRLGVAANLLNYIATYQIDGAESVGALEFWELGLLHIAAAGPYISTSSRNVDICQMVRVLLDKGHPVDQKLDRSGSLFYGIRQSPRPILHDAPPLMFMLLVDQSLSHRDDEIQLSVARTLLQLGANADGSVPFEGHRLDKAAYYELTILEYCVRFRSAPFVRLLIEHGAIIGPGPGSMRLLEIAYFRQDRELIQTLHDFGLGSPINQGVPLQSVADALVATGQIGAAFSGGIPASHCDHPRLKMGGDCRIHPALEGHDEETFR